MRVIYRPEPARRSPCYGCERMGRRGYPECADACEPMARYRREEGLPETSLAERKAAEAQREKRREKRERRLRLDPEVEALRQFIKEEMRRLDVTYAELARRVGVERRGLSAFAKGEIRKTKKDNMERLRAYRQEVEGHGARH